MHGKGSVWTALSEVRRGQAHVTARVLAAIFGGYAFSAAWVALLAVLLSITGMARSEAVILGSMLGFLIYLGALIWAFAERRLKRVWLVLPGGAVLVYALMRLLKAWMLGA